MYISTLSCLSNVLTFWEYNSKTSKIVITPENIFQVFAPENLFDTLGVDAGGSLDMEELIARIAKLRGVPRRTDVNSISLMLKVLQLSFQQFEATTNEALAEQHNKRFQTAR